MVYDTAHQNSPPEDHIRTIAQSNNVVVPPGKPRFGIDSCLGLMASSIGAPLYLYASLKGKFQVWDEVLDGLPEDCLHGPALDVGCGRGLVLLKIAERKKKIADKLAASVNMPPVSPAYGMDIFRTSDQSGNSPVATYKNAAAMDVVGYTVLHTASFTQKYPFSDDVFALVTSCLAIHNVDKDGRVNAVKEMARVCAPGGRIILIDLYGYFKGHEHVLSELEWEGVKVSYVGFRMSYGALPCQILTAQKVKAQVRV